MELMTILADNKTKEARLAKCKSCPFIKANMVCGKCGCVLIAKTRLQVATCPIGNW